MATRPLLGPSSALRVTSLVTLLLPAVLAACSDNPRQTNTQPAIPGDACTPAAQRCVDGSPADLEICRTDGRGWISSQCPVGSSCAPASNTCVSNAVSCTAGATRCTGSPGTAARETCSSDGSGWLSQPCEGELVCDSSTGSCATPACDPGESKCDGGPTDPGRSVCADSRLAFMALPCADDASCVTTPTGAKCVTRVCTPGDRRCAADHMAVLTCDASGTVMAPSKTCSANQVCMAADCVASATPFGDVVVEQQTPELELGPGRYALAVVDTSIANDLENALPVQVVGDVADPPAMTPPKLTSVGQRACVSLELVRHYRAPVESRASPGGAPAPMWTRSDDTREFHVPDPATNGAVVFVRTAKLRAVGQYVNLWEDQTISAPGTLLPDSLLSDVLSRLDDAVIPRVKVMSGDPTDVDGNGRIDYLFTDVLPTAAAAAIVFPRATLFPSAPGAVQTDFGEIVYSQGLNAGLGEAELMAILAHETQHLVYFGRRLAPYFADPASIPASIGDDVYAVEGLATAAMAWSGQYFAPPMVAALEQPSEFSLWRLSSSEYLQDASVNLASYGYGALVQQYFMQQAGGFTVQGSGSLMVDSGGAAQVDAFTLAPSGWARIGPLDGRPLASWYADFAAALLVETLGSKVSAATASDPLYQLGAAVADPVWGGFIGPTLRYEWTVGASASGPILQRVPWSQRPATLKAGGMSFLDLGVGEAGAKLAVGGADTRVVIVRYEP